MQLSIMMILQIWGLVGKYVRVTLIPTSVLGLPQAIDIDKRPDKKFRQGFIRAPAVAGVSKKQVTVSLVRSPRGESWFIT